MKIGSLGLSLLAALLLAASGAVAGEADSSEPAKPAKTEKVNPMVVLNTSLGDIQIELYPQEAPLTVENFLQYVDDGFYDGTVFHRVVPGFVIQGGGMRADGSRKQTRAPIKNEAQNGLKNDRGWLSMARTSDVDSATSQFFINLVDNDFLNHGARDFGYAVFAKVVAGLDVVDAIAEAGARGNVEIRSAKRQ